MGTYEAPPLAVWGLLAESYMPVTLGRLTNDGSDSIWAYLTGTGQRTGPYATRTEALQALVGLEPRPLRMLAVDLYVVKPDGQVV
jgi:hypothetical protein